MRWEEVLPDVFSLPSPLQKCISSGFWTLTDKVIQGEHHSEATVAGNVPNASNEKCGRKRMKLPVAVLSIWMYLVPVLNGLPGKFCHGKASFGVYCLCASWAGHCLRCLGPKHPLPAFGDVLKMLWWPWLGVPCRRGWSEVIGGLVRFIRFNWISRFPLSTRKIQYIYIIQFAGQRCTLDTLGTSVGKSCRFDSLPALWQSTAAWGLESCLFLATRQGGLGLTFCDSNVQQKTPIWRDMGRRAFSLVGYPRGKGMGSLWIETHYGSFGEEVNLSVSVPPQCVEKCESMCTTRKN